MPMKLFSIKASVEFEVAAQSRDEAISDLSAELFSIYEEQEWGGCKLIKIEEAQEVEY